MLSPIRIPYSPRRKANATRYGYARTDVEQCLLCLKPVNEKTRKVVVLDEGLGQIIDPASPEGQGERNGGCFYIGSDCWKKNAQLHPYEVQT